MISHAKTMVINKSNRHPAEVNEMALQSVSMGNSAEGVSASGSGIGAVNRDMLILSFVNIEEEKAL